MYKTLALKYDFFLNQNECFMLSKCHRIEDSPTLMYEDVTAITITFSLRTCTCEDY